MSNVMTVVDVFAVAVKASETVHGSRSIHIGEFEAQANNNVVNRP